MSDDDADLPEVSAPARRALAAAGITRLEQLADVRDAAQRVPEGGATAAPRHG